MTYIVTEACIRCKYMDCAEVCPVNCFHEGENMLVINPETCIDCGVCEPACPAKAITSDQVPDAEFWVEFNKKYASLWPKADYQGIPPADADEWLGKPNKLKHFSENPSHDR